MYRNSAGLGALLILAGASLTGNAHATSVSATAQLFGMSQASGPTLTFSNDFFTQDAQTSALGDTFATGTTAQDIVVGSNPFAESSWSLFAAPYTNAGVSGKGSASSLFQWSFDYVASGTGSVTLDFDYNYAAQLVGLNAGDSAGVSSRIDVLRDGVPSSEVERFYFVSNQEGSSAGEDHILLTFDAVNGQRGTVTFTASSQGYVNPVPLPAAIWLLTSALGALGLVRRSVA
jgi:hypothetical protein